MPVTIDYIKSIYQSFREAQADFKNRAYRMPKDFEKHFNERFQEQNQKALIKISGWFLTKWQSINPYEYFKCGFELYGNRFTYTKFFKEKIILLYKVRDKNKKRSINITKKGLVESAFFVKKWIKDNDLTFNRYIREKNGNHKIAVDHYLKNKIDAHFFVYLIQKGMILTDHERALIPYIQINYRKIIDDLNEIREFIKKLGDKIL